MFILSSIISVSALEIKKSTLDDYGVDLLCDDFYHSILPKQGASTIYTVTINNVGNLDDTYDVTASSIEDIVCLVNGVNADQNSPYQISLEASESATFDVKVEIYSFTPDPPLGEWPITVDARSQNDPVAYDTLELIVNIATPSICGYVYASDGITPLEKAGITVDDLDCIWETDKNGFYAINGFSLIGQLDMYVYPPTQNTYMPLFDVAELTPDKICWMNFTLDDYRPYNNPPDKPTIDGPTSCKIGEEYDYTFVSDDPDSDELYLAIKIDGADAYYSKNNFVAAKVTYTKTGDFEIKACAIDKYGKRSETAVLPVSVPRNRQLMIQNSLVNYIYDNFPILAQLLKI